MSMAVTPLAIVLVLQALLGCVKHIILHAWLSLLERCRQDQVAAERVIIGVRMKAAHGYF